MREKRGHVACVVGGLERKRGNEKRQGVRPTEWIKEKIGKRTRQKERRGNFADTETNREQGRKTDTQGYKKEVACNGSAEECHGGNISLDSA